jgi:hypothetical protein
MEDDRKDSIQKVMLFSFKQDLYVRRTVLFCVLSVCNPKQNISRIFLNMMSKNLTLTDTMPNWNSGEGCVACRHTKLCEVWSVTLEWGQKLPGAEYVAHVSSCVCKIAKVTWASSYLLVRPSSCYNSASNGRFSWNVVFEGFSKICLEKWVWLNSDKHNGYFTWRCRHIYDYISLNVS